MKLSDDLRILRNLRVRYKYAIIQNVAHLYTHHAEAMSGITGEELKDMIYSDEPVEEIATALEGK